MVKNQLIFNLVVITDIKYLDLMEENNTLYSAYLSAPPLNYIHTCPVHMHPNHKYIGYDYKYGRMTGL